MENNKILIAADDQRLIVQLKDMLATNIYDITTAIDGPSALQKILSNTPALVIIELNLKIIGGAKIAQIIRTNPKTSATSFFFLSDSPVEIESFVKFKDALILKPFNYDEVISRINAHFKSLEKAPEVSDLNKEISGHLSQISLVDLLQVFNMNKKSGKLVIKYENKSGAIYIKDGDIINARIDELEGEKAFYRLMMLKEGRFNFYPEEFGDVSVTPKITKKTDNLLMEGLRQMDEWQKMKNNFPDLNATISLKVDPRTLVKEMKNITREIFILMEFYTKVNEIVNNCSYSDYEVLKTLYVLLQKGIIQETSPNKKEVEKTFLLTSEQLVKIKKRLLETKGFRLNKKFGKILVISEDFEDLKKIIQMFLLLNEFSINQKDLMSAEGSDFLGILGTLKLSEGMNILFYSIPMLDSFKPLWNSLSQNVITVLLLIPYNPAEIKGAAEVKSAYDFFNNRLKKIVKPILISDTQISGSELTKAKETYGMNELFNYNTEDKEEIRDFFVNLLIEIL